MERWACAENGKRFAFQALMKLDGKADDETGCLGWEKDKGPIYGIAGSSCELSCSEIGKSWYLKLQQRCVKDNNPRTNVESGSRGICFVGELEVFGSIGQK